MVLHGPIVLYIITLQYWSNMNIYLEEMTANLNYPEKHSTSWNRCTIYVHMIYTKYLQIYKLKITNNKQLQNKISSSKITHLLYKQKTRIFTYDLCLNINVL